MSNVEQFGKYILLEKIATGGMAEVYLAKSNGANGVNKFVAIKRILPQFSSNEDFIAMFKEEAKVAINLNHSNVVSIYDFGIEKKQFFIVMEFVEGRNLRQIINELKKMNKSISIDQAIFIVKEAAAGLDHAHRCTDSHSGRPLNITHRDMSPQNIMVSFEGETKVIDFGIAKAENEAETTKAGTLKGKFAYMSPEQSEGLPIDPRTDVFALGIILWELLANDRLFTGSNEAAILRKVRECNIPSIRKINPMVPAELERIVMKALARDKNVRYQTAANLHKDLNRFLNTQYPDFSSQDFSSFVRECFKAAYTEGREKLILFAKVKFDEELANTQANLKSLENQKPMTPKIPFPKTENKPTQPELKGLSSEQKLKINLDGIRSASANKQPATAQSYSPQQSGNTSVTAHQSGKTNTGYPSYSSHQNSDLFFKFIFILAFSFTSFWGYKKFLGNEIPESVKLTSPNKVPDNSTEGQFELSATAQVRLSFTSDPVGAQIFIDGKDTKQTTPAVVSVVANKELNFSLRKEGYLNYELSKSYTQTGSFSGTLQRVGSMGYINIHVINGGVRPVVFINGQRLSESPPIKKYAVPANSEVIVKVANSITQLSDETKIRVPANTTKDIELILGREQGTPKK